MTWVQLDGKQDYQKRLFAARARPPDTTGHVLIIADSKSPETQRQIASQTPGAVTVEAVDLKDLVSFARGFDPRAENSLALLVHFAETVMTNVGASDLLRRVDSLRHGRARNPATNVERSALAFLRTCTWDNAADLLFEISKEAGVRTHRPAVLRACIKALQSCTGSNAITLYDATIQLREQYRLIGRPLPRRAVGSTLLLKGLEAEVAVVLNADDLDARNLYVAMTRGSKALTICSRAPVLNPL